MFGFVERASHDRLSRDVQTAATLRIAPNTHRGQGTANRNPNLLQIKIICKSPLITGTHMDW